ncbi:YbaK/EbsC family protein [Pseudohoeflea suaedae]|uniref:YbaK/EbsC family protein n=1 Tax=Pseudohoeflea suaedae TaxID=877384 RepID=A0A4R5PKN5_9HYPH|nr:YbaK/EbsC family protein [Pseudohoeflea suaedae]TDH36291.1 YbaK/EbsC family protein [Pseudohoeflea suaedae]
MSKTVLKRDELPAGSSIRRVSETATELGLDIEIVRMADSTRTAEDAAAACQCQVGQIVKSLVFENSDTGAITLLLVSGAHNADLDHLASVHGLKLGRCDGRRVRDETGFAIGGVAPIGHKIAVPVYMDEALMSHDIVWAAAGRPDSVFSVDPKALAQATGASVISVRPGSD